MGDYCAFIHNHRCIKWVDYEITRHELEEADALCHGNWITLMPSGHFSKRTASNLQARRISDGQKTPLNKGFLLVEQNHCQGDRGIPEPGVFCRVMAAKAP